jgi:DNA-binding NarL/FixJ family response regulator
VKVHVHNVMKKLKVTNRTEAAMAARNMRIVPALLQTGH